MASILIPTPLRQFVGGNDTVEAEATTVGEALRQLVAAHPQIERNLFNEQGRLRSFVNVYVDDEDIRYLDREETALEGTSTISIVPSIAGGAPAAAAAPVGVSETDLPELSNAEILRFSRHLILPEVGLAGQRRLKGAKILMVGTAGWAPPWDCIWRQPGSAGSGSSTSTSSTKRIFSVR